MYRDALLVCWGLITCYGVDADALDPEAFRWRKLSVELCLHDLVVPNVPALWFKQTQHN